MVRFRKILCPVDFFPASERAVAYAMKLGAPDHARIKLLHVVPFVVPTGYDFPTDSAALTEALENNSRLQLRGLMERTGLTGTSVDVDVRRGDVSSEIQKAIQTDRPDLVAMGTHGRRGFERWIMGSTTERLLRHSPVPVLVISESQKKVVAGPAFRRILAPTDLSPESSGALRYAFSIAEKYRSRVLVLHVLEEMRAITSAAHRNRLAPQIKSRLSKLVPRELLERCRVDTKVEAGTPFHVILTRAEKWKVDLLVMSTHGKGMLDRALLGSTTDRVVKAAVCPVLLIPPGSRKRWRNGKESAST
jgi:nucleotide-binding universal stress UspA family protein